MIISNLTIIAKNCRYGTAALQEAAMLIRAGHLVAAPTETVYGLAADAFDSDAVASIYSAKGRPSFNPLIVHVTDLAMARTIGTFSPLACQLAQAFWPGPLTLVVPLRDDSRISPLVTAGLSTIALRVPAHPVMQALIRESGRPLAAPSANASGGISPTRAEHVMASLGHRIRMVLDAGPTSEGIESTIVAPGDGVVRLLRPGPVTADQITELTGLPVLLAGEGDPIEAPGQLASHYAPKKPLRLNATDAQRDEFLIGFGEMPCTINLSANGNLVEAATNLFAALHQADASAARAIAIAAIPETGIGLAINDRLRRAAV